MITTTQKVTNRLRKHTANNSSTALKTRRALCEFHARGQAGRQADSCANGIDRGCVLVEMHAS